MYFAVIVVLSYITFVFLSESLVPFPLSNRHAPIHRSRSKHRRLLAYWCSLSLLIAALLVHFLFKPLENFQDLLVVLALATALSIPGILYYGYKKFVVAKV